MNNSAGLDFSDPNDDTTLTQSQHAMSRIGICRDVFYKVGVCAVSFGHCKGGQSRAQPHVKGSVTLEQIGRSTWARSCAIAVILLACLSAATLSALTRHASAEANSHATPPLQTALVVIDNVTLTIKTPFLPSSTFIVAKPGLPSQVASSVQLKPFQEISITAIPFGTQAGTELNVVAKAGGAAKYLAALRTLRNQQHAQQQPGPIITIFGRKAPSEVSLVSLKLDSVNSKPTLVVEWVGEAGNRLWLVRVSQEEPVGTTHLASLRSFINSLSAITVTSTTLYKLSTLSDIPPAPTTPHTSGNHTPGSSHDLPHASWWNSSACDTSIVSGSYPLGTYYQGMPACGSRHALSETTKFPGVQQQEWQPSELSMRYMYLAYGVPGYRTSTGGGSLVEDYAGSYPLQKISNGTMGQAPEPGDVLSFSPNDASGFTAVVMSAQVNHSGNGIIQVIEEGGAPGGADILTVRNWQVQVTSWGGWVSGWLHPSQRSGGNTYTVASAATMLPRTPQVISGFKLPYPGGQTRTVTQGNGDGDHTGQSYYSWDFAILGSSANWVIVAAKAGTVTQIREDVPDYNCGQLSCWQTVNYVVIDHGDGTQTLYMHIKQYGVSPFVHVGQVIAQGQPIAYAGSSGWSTGVHLHYEVEQTCGTWWCNSVSSSFDDVAGGIPVMNNNYTSGNYYNGGGCSSAPNLNSPGNGVTLNSRTVSFSWGPPNGCSPDGYTFRINTSPSGDSGPFIVDTGIGPGTPNYTYTLNSDGTYYWHVRACKPCSPYTPGQWADRSFAINTTPTTPDPPTLQSPANGSTQTSRTVTFSWSPPNSPNITGYTLHVSTSSTIDGSGAPLILDTGVGGTSYTYTFSQDYSTLWWSVATLNSSNQRSSFASAWTFAINTTPPDTTPPTVTWTLPVTDGGVYHCQSGPVQLQASASDNVAVARVDFLRFDSVNNTWVNLGTAYSAPYQVSVDCGTLNATWNQTNTVAYDTSGNASTTNTFIWLYRDVPPPAPSNLTTQVANCQQTDLSWTDNSSGQANFNIYRDGVLIGQVGTTVTSFQDSGLSGSSSYSYTVTAVSGNLESTPSNTANATTPNCPSVANDDFNNPTVLSAPHSSLTQDTTYATAAIDDPTSNCGQANSHSVWFSFTPTSNLNVTLSTAGSNYDTVLVVWTGARGSLTAVTCDDDYGGTLTSQVSFSANAGTTYAIEAMSYSTSQGGSLILTEVAVSISTTWYFGEGYTGAGFSEFLTLANPNSAPATVQVTYLLDVGSPVIKTYAVAATSRYTVYVNSQVPAGHGVSMVVSSDLPVVAERPMYFTYGGHSGVTIPGGTDVLGATALGTQYDFGYLDTSGVHDTFLTILNPQASSMSVTINYYAAAGGAPTTIVHSVPANSRGTVFVGGEGLPSGQYGALVTLSVPGLVERPMYLVDGTTGYTGSADVVGVSQPLTNWYFAEGYTAATFSERYMLFNPGTTSASATLTFLKSDGTTATATATLAAGAQQVVDANSVLGSGGVNNSATVTATAPIVAERFMSFSFPGTTAIPGATDVIGAAAPGYLAYFAEGYTGSGFNEYLTLENPDPTNTAYVLVKYLPSSGGEVIKALAIAPHSRYTVYANSIMPNQSFSMVVQSGMPVVAERPMYFNYNNGQTGGTDVLGYQP